MYRLIVYAINPNGTIHRRFTETKTPKDLKATLEYYKCQSDIDLQKVGDIALLIGDYVIPDTKVEIHVIKIS